MTLLIKWLLVILTFILSIGLAIGIAWLWEQRDIIDSSFETTTTIIRKHKPAEQTLLDFIAEAEKNIETIKTEQLKYMIETKEPFVLLDVRTLDEIKQTGVIEAPKVVNSERGMLEFRILQQLTNKDTPIVVSCTTGGRSLLAAETLRKMGYTNVKNFEGITAWLAKGYKTKDYLTRQ